MMSYEHILEYVEHRAEKYKFRGFKLVYRSKPYTIKNYEKRILRLEKRRIKELAKIGDDEIVKKAICFMITHQAGRFCRPTTAHILDRVVNEEKRYSLKQAYRDNLSLIETQAAVAAASRFYDNKEFISGAISEFIIDCLTGGIETEDRGRMSDGDIKRAVIEKANKRVDLCFACFNDKFKESFINDVLEEIGPYLRTLSPNIR